jgi:putative ATP-binding cassette transporter
MQHVDDLKSMEKIKREQTAENRITLDKVNTVLPDGRLLSRDVNVSFSPGDSVIITGPSGCGKSTLLRAVAGIWPYGEGTVFLPSGKEWMFLSQKPYLPMGSLRDAFYYPGDVKTNGDELKGILDACGLSHLADKLDDAEHWGQTLSPGEQQRIAIARVLLHRPDFAFLDEATSSLDETTESHLYGLLRERLPETALVSVSHRSTLYAWHKNLLALGIDGSWKIGTVPGIKQQ